MNEPEIVKCPFCSEKDCRIKQYNAYTNNSYFCVGCHGCHAEGPTADTKEEAIRLWNTAFRPLDSLYKDKLIDWLAQAAANAGLQGQRVSAKDMIAKAKQEIRTWYNKEKQKEQSNGQDA